MSATSDASATARAPLEGAKPLEDIDVVDLLRRAYTTKELQAQYAVALGRKTTSQQNVDSREDRRARVAEGARGGADAGHTEKIS